MESSCTFVERPPIIPKGLPVKNVFTHGFVLPALLTAVMAATVTPAHAISIIVDGTTCTLTDAILAANSGGTVGGCTGSGSADTLDLDADVTLIAADTVNSDDLQGAYAGLPTISSDITIQAGTGTLIERDSTLGCVANDPNPFRIFNIDASGVLTLDGLTLQNGCAAPPAGTSAHAGAVYVPDGSLVVQNCSLNNNQAISLTNNGTGGAIYAWRGQLSVTSSTFINNYAQGDFAQGGAIHLGSTATGKVIDDNIFTANQAVDNGNNAGNGSIGRGGALASSTDFMSISGNTFINNLAQGGDGSASGGTASGGGIYNAGAITTFANNIFDNNRAIGGDGGTGDGGDGDGGGTLSRSSTTMIKNSRFVNNLAQGGDSTAANGGDAEGGGLSTGNGPASSNLTIINNTAQGGNGAVDGGYGLGGGYEGYHNIQNSTISNNTAQGGTGGSGAGGNAYGGGWYMDDEPEPNHVTVANNQAIAGTGTTDGIALGGGIAIFDYGFYFSNSIFADNTVTPVGGSPTANDCDWLLASYDNSYGYNIIEFPGTCAFTFDATDRTGVDPELGPLADHGCLTTLPDGSCAETISLLSTSPAIDAGSCVISGLTDDQVGTSRPFDVIGVPDVVDGCDIGAYEELPSFIYSDGFENLGSD